MDKYIRDIFKNKKPNKTKLLSYGFEFCDDRYVYSTKILSNTFKLTVCVQDDNIATKLVDVETNELYTLHLNEDFTGSYVGDIRTAYTKVLTDVSNKCFDTCVFKSDYAQKIVEYIFNYYGDTLEFLWPKFSNNAIVRRSDNKKWYAIMVNIELNKLSTVFKGNNTKVDVLVLRSSCVKQLIDHKTYFEAYHMNKNNWLGVLLNNNLNLEDVFKLIDDSFELAKK